MEVKDILAEFAAVPEGTFLDVLEFSNRHIEGSLEVTVLTDAEDPREADP